MIFGSICGANEAPHTALHERRSFQYGDTRYPGLCVGAVCVEHNRMEQLGRIHTYDDELHARRRRLAVVREPIDFEAERLKRLIEKARDTRDP